MSLTVVEEGRREAGRLVRREKGSSPPHADVIRPPWSSPTAVLGGLGGAPPSPSLGQLSLQNSWYWNILALYDLRWRPDQQASSQDLFKVGASLNLWSCLAGATAKKRSVGNSVTSLEGWPVTSFQPGRTESPERGRAYGKV